MNDFNKLMDLLNEIENAAIELNVDVEIREQKTKAEKIKSSDKIKNELSTKKVVSQLKKQKTIYTQERKKLANEVSRMASTANKRLDRLVKNNLEGQSAYKAWYDEGAIRFSVKGKSYQELQREYWRVQKFLDAQTSTVKGARENLERVAKEVMKLKADEVKKMSLQELNDATTNFFKISDAMQDYYEKINDNAKRIDYQKIFTEIEQYFDIGDLLEIRSDTDFDELVEQMREYIDAETALEQMIDLWE